jgi:uncharacterized protein with ParB-like and HNH nuclease domain
MASEKFEITANTYVLLDSNTKSKSILKSKYTIPVYQRPYSWNKEQIVRLIRDIFEAFRGIEGDKESEPMFIGTMQLKPESEETYIIDGQQRLTTLLILLKILHLKYQVQELQNINFDYLETEVNGGEQQKHLAALLSLNNEDLERLTEEVNQNKTKEIEHFNCYIKNAIVINQELDKQTKIENQDNENTQKLNISYFVEYLFNKVHFVVIETTAGLSKTLKIFDAINTTGMDLNTADIFKVRMYEYLTKNKSDKKDHKDIFKNISALYEKIDNCNEIYKKKVTSIQEVLRIYQFYLIGKYDLPNPLYGFATDTFYERLFETIFKINTNWPNFQKTSNLILELGVIDGLIDARFLRYELWLNMQAEEKMYQYLWGRSRYNNRKILMDVYLYENGENGFTEFVKNIVKTFLEYSLYYDRVVNEIRNGFTKYIINCILNKAPVKRKQLEEKDKKRLNDRLNGEVFHLTTAKNILCRLSASLEVLYKYTSGDCIREIDYIFTEKMDIEHIQSQTDKEKDISNNEWGNGAKNKLGNLVLLERNINISISNETDKKLELVGENGYPSSNLTIVNSTVLGLVKGLEGWVWSEQKEKERRKKEINKIWNFIYSENSFLQDK